MEELTIDQLKEKYSKIEDKIPSVWPNYEKAGIELAQDLSYGHWNIKDPELIRVISLVELEVNGLSIAQHIYEPFSFAGLYPHKMKAYDINPEILKNNE
jgi:hypothetical protein